MAGSQPRLLINEVEFLATVSINFQDVRNWKSSVFVATSRCDYWFFFHIYCTAESLVCHILSGLLELWDPITWSVLPTSIYVSGKPVTNWRRGHNWHKTKGNQSNDFSPKNYSPPRGVHLRLCDTLLSYSACSLQLRYTIKLWKLLSCPWKAFNTELWTWRLALGRLDRTTNHRREPNISI